MGLEAAAVILGGIAIASEVGKSNAEINAAEARERALDLQAKQTAIQTQQKTLQNYDVLQKVIDAQEAHMTVTGTSFSSPSFNAIQRNSENISSKKQKNIDLEGQIAQENIEAEKDNVRNSLHAQLFGNALEGASLAFSAAKSVPTKG